MTRVAPAASPTAGSLALRQRGLCLGCVLLASGCWVWWWPARPWLATLGVAWCLLGWWMAVLAFQVLAARRENVAACRAKSVGALPAPDWPTTLRVWLWACRTAPQVFFWRQPWQEHRWPDVLPAPQGWSNGTSPNTLASVRAVLFVHGFVSNRGFWNPWLARLTARGEPFVAVSVQQPFALLDAQAAELSAHVDRIVAATGRPPLIVGHSMGGLIIRAWLRREARMGLRWQERVHHVVCIGSPLAGTGLARWSPLPLARQMAREADGGQWLPQLNADLHALGIPQTLFSCWASNADNMVFPAHSALLPAAARREIVHGVPHVPLAFEPALMQAVLALR